MARCLVILASLGTLLDAAGVDARTWHIKSDGTGDAPTIQAAIDSAVAAESLLIAPGLYNENLDTHGKGLVLLGPSTGEAIIDGGQRGRVLSLDSGGQVERLTIRNGRAEIGAGIRIVGPGPCLIRNNVIEENTALNSLGGGGGGGIAHWGVAEQDIVIEGNEIRNNLTQLGGGIWQFLSFGQVPVHFLVRRNRIRENQAGDSGGGIKAESAIIEGNLIVRNTAGYVGGGIAFDGDALAGEIRRNTIALNATYNGLENGAGVSAHAGTGSVTITNNLVWRNHGPTGGPPSGAGIECGAGLFPVSCNLLWGNDIDLGDCAPPESNVSQDPLFCGVDPGVSLNFYIQSDSPCAPEHSGGCGLIGAFSVGCGTTRVEGRTWSYVKGLYR